MQYRMECHIILMKFNYYIFFYTLERLLFYIVCCIGWRGSFTEECSGRAWLILKNTNINDNKQGLLDSKHLASVTL